MGNKLGKDFESAPMVWMNGQGKIKDLPHLLAFADDGIISGKMQNDAYVLSSNVPVRSGTLQRVHLFGPSGELRISRVDTGFEEVWFDNTGVNADDLLQEKYMLWSEDPKKTGNITIQHYIAYDDTGQAYISHSRLLELKDS